MNCNGKEFAYPSPGEAGMTIREVMAKDLMVGLYAAIHSDYQIHEQACKHAGLEQGVPPTQANMEKYSAKWAVKAADALINELNK